MMMHPSDLVSLKIQFAFKAYQLPYFCCSFAGVYSALGISEAITLLGRDVFFFIRLAVTAKFIHEDLLKGVLQSPMQFFDTHPLGRIINRFSSDMDTFEQLIPWQLSDAIWCFAEFIVTLIMISYALPIFLTVIVPIVLFFFMVQRIYIVTSRQISLAMPFKIISLIAYICTLICTCINFREVLF